MPRVTVLMPAHNASLYIRDAIASILTQTFDDYEFLIINDGSSDDTEQIIRSYTDPRIRLFSLANNVGVIQALNEGLRMALGEYIVRMDADDISLPCRIEKQVEFMDKNPEVGVSGSYVEYIGARSGIGNVPSLHNDILWSMVFGPPFFHPTVILRRDVLLASKIIYPATYPHAEDYAMWVSLCGITSFRNLPEVLVNYRVTIHSVSSVHRDTQNAMSSAIQKEAYEKLLGRPIDDDEWALVNMADNSPVNLAAVVNFWTNLLKKNSISDDGKVNKGLKQIILKKRIDQRSLFWLIGRTLFHRDMIRYIFKARWIR